MKTLTEKIVGSLEKLSVAAKHSATTSDLADRLVLKGKVFEGFIDWAADSLCSLPEGDYFSLRVDGETLARRDDIRGLLKMKDTDLDSWELTFNKQSFFESVEATGSTYFFLTFQSLKSWLEVIDVLSIDSIPDDTSQISIFLWEAKKSFGGTKFRILSPNDYTTQYEKWPAVKLPDKETVRSQVHIMANKVAIWPDLFLITHLSDNKEVDRILLTNCFLHLASTLVQYFYSRDLVSLKGIRSVDLPLIGANEHPSLQDIAQLLKAVEWAYEERADTRIKLLSDRLCLETNDQASFYEVLVKHLEQAYQQAREQYKFVILDRKDKYYQELRSLLVGLQGQSKAYSEKLHSMTDGLFRDVFASLFLVAFGLFSKTDVNKIDDLLENPYLLWLLKGLGIYFFISYFFQLINNYYDLKISKKELKFWIDTTHDYLSEEEVEGKMKEAAISRERNYRQTVIVLGVFYVLIGLFCWFLGDWFGG